ncbi:MAG: cellulase family glycosylhydrolase [Oscillospiraceae bacterium]|nr:cellulase family glycosylhydrolase [Oscillospiraceae bacterium]
MDKLTVKGTRIVDSHGRERILTGLNVCDKGRYIEGQRRIYGEQWTKGLAAGMKAHGMDLVRLGITWDAIEPEPGEYNEEYLDFIGGILDECKDSGVYVFLDMHQDLFSGTELLCGDGAPKWATLTGKYKYQPTKIVWAEGYFWGKAVHGAFDSFWNNTKVNGKGVQVWFEEMWTHVIEKFGDHPAVIGFDFFNEPFPGKSGGKVFREIIGRLVSTTVLDKTISKKKLIELATKSDDPARVLDLYTGKHLRKITSAGDDIIKTFDTKKYFPFINKMARATRKCGNEKFVFLENSYYSNLGIPYSCPRPILSGRTDNNVIFSPHAYDFMVDTPSYKYASNDRVGSIFAEHRRSQQRLGVPVIVGEWGGFTEGDEWFPHIEFLLDLFDSYKWSNTYWCYFGGFTDTEVYKKVLTRPHPVAVTGEIESYGYDRENKEFHLSFVQLEETKAKTEIFVPSVPKYAELDGEEIAIKRKGIFRISTAPGEHKIKIIFK